MPKDNKLRQYIYEALIKIDVICKYDISSRDIAKLMADTKILFVEKSKSPILDDFKML